jgi:penicillin-binding protein 1C
VWVGNADGQPMEAISGVTGAGPVWHDVMLAAHQGLPARLFERPAGIVEHTICAEGGMLPSQNCPATRQERFMAGQEPTQPDRTHIAVPIDPALGCRAPASYPADRVAMRVFRILPPEAEPWMVAAGLPRVPPEICSPLVGSVSPPDKQTRRQGDGPVANSGGSLSPNLPVSLSVAPALIAPASGAVFAISPGIPLERQQVEFKARAGAEVTNLTIYIDGQPLAAFAGPPYRAFWQLAPGAHHASVSVTDEHGKEWRSAVIEFVVEATQ